MAGGGHVSDLALGDLPAARTVPTSDPHAAHFNRAPWEPPRCPRQREGNLLKNKWKEEEKRAENSGGRAPAPRCSRGHFSSLVGDPRASVCAARSSGTHHVCASTLPGAGRETTNGDPRMEAAEGN